MSYGLSFTEAFFTGEEETTETDRPTSVLEAIENLPLKTKLGIAREVLKSAHPVQCVRSESFAYDVLDVVRKTDTCSNLDSPVRVWIDPEMDYFVEVWDSLDK